MVTLSSESRPIIGRGPPLGLRFFILAVASIVLMVVDQRADYLTTARLWMSVAVRPLYSVVQAPFEAWNWMTGNFSDRDTLRSENERLKEQLRSARVRLLRFESLNEENQRLRAIRAASQGISERTLIAEIMQVDVDPFRHRVLINKGSDAGVFKEQPLLDAFGILGQVTRVYPDRAEAILISDIEHAIPVQVNRNGIRSIAVGTGNMNRLSLPFLTVESDVKEADLLVSSGLDEIFPAGYPVARISKVERNSSETFALVEAIPMAQLDRVREVLLLWPATPAAEETAVPEKKSEPKSESPAR